MSLIRKMRLNDPLTDRDFRINPGNGAMAVDNTIRLLGPQFVGSVIDAEFWTLANNGAASVAALASGLVSLASGTENDGSGSLVSFANARFLFVNPNQFRMACRVTSAIVADCTRRWGAMNITAGSPLDLDNGFYYSLDPAGVLSINYKTTGSGVISVASGSFNGEVSTYVVDTDVHAYEILYFEMGLWFTIDNIFIHKITPTTLKLTDNFTLGIVAESVNSGSGTTSGVLEVFASSILRLGSDDTVPHFKNLAANATTVLKRSAGKLHRIIVNLTGASSVITIYDNTAASGSIIATIGSANEGTFEYGIEFHTGLTIVIGGGTASDITVVYD